MPSPSPIPSDRVDAPLAERRAPLTRYQRWLFFFLSVATFFEGYDLFALAQILPNLRADMGLDPVYAGFLVSFASVGNVLAYFVVDRADPNH